MSPSRRLVSLVTLSFALVLWGCDAESPDVESAPSSGAATAQALSPPGYSAVAGVATFSPGSGPGSAHVQRVPVEVVADQVFLDFPPLTPGDWKIALDLVDVTGRVVFHAASRVVVGAARPMPSRLDVTNQDGLTVTAVDKRSVLLLWNTLDDAAAIADSRVGVPGAIVGTVAFTPVRHGAGVGDFADATSAVTFDGAFGSEQRSAFAVEAWVRWGDATHKDFCLFCVQGESNGWANETFAVLVAESPSTPGHLTRDIAVVLRWLPNRFLEYVWHTDVPAAGFVEHLAISADINRPTTEKFRLFLDGVDQGPPNQAVVEVSAGTWFEFPRWVRLGQTVPSTPWVLGASLDDLKVWAYPKGDFADRFTE